jgi:ribosomal protein L37AE/L43A
METVMEILVISNFDLAKFGCPYCGSLEGDTFITNGSCSIWNCECCIKNCAVVGKSIKEVLFAICDTDITDLIGNHPYQNDCQINSFSLRMNNLPSC